MNKKILLALIPGLLVGGIVLAISNYTITDSVVTIMAPEPVNDEVMGAMPGNELWSETFSVDGVTRHYYHQAFATATNTPYALQTPGVTTTIELFNFGIATGTSTAANLEFSTSTNAFNTSTDDALIDTVAVAASAQISYQWSSVGGIVPDNIVPPNTWILLQAIEKPAGGFTYGGAFVNIILQEF